LILREFSSEDAQVFFEMNNASDVIKYTGDKAFKSVQEAEAFIAAYSHYEQYGYGRWAICLKPNSGFIGFCGLKYHPEPGITEVGYRLIKKYWGKGIATEATLACINHGFPALITDLTS